jgi:hypothetical protein
MTLTSLAFDQFKIEESNSNLVSSGKFGIHELVNDEFVTKEITEDEFSKYTLIDHTTIDDTIRLKLNADFACYPFVQAN